MPGWASTLLPLPLPLLAAERAPHAGPAGAPGLRLGKRRGRRRRFSFAGRERRSRGRFRGGQFRPGWRPRSRAAALGKSWPGVRARGFSDQPRYTLLDG